MQHRHGGTRLQKDNIDVDKRRHIVRTGSCCSFASVVTNSSGLFLKFSSETDIARTGDVVCLLAALHQPKNDGRPAEIATNGKRQKRDNEHRTAHNPKSGAHTNWVGASMVHRGADSVTVFLGRLSGLTRQPQTSELNNHITRDHRTWQYIHKVTLKEEICNNSRSANTRSCFSTSRAVRA